MALYLNLYLTAMPSCKLKQSEKILFSVWVLLGFCLSTVYKSNLKAMLTAQKVDIPFETLEDLVNAHDFTVYMQYGTYHTNYIRVSKTTSIKSNSCIVYSHAIHGWTF